jgi:hypothetical protein
METNYLDFGTPISFGWTARYLDTKTCTRRDWKDSHAAKFVNAYDRAAAAGQQLRVPAIDKAYHADGKQIGWCIFTVRPYKEALNAMGFHDLCAEGGMCSSTEEFVQKYFKGNDTLEVWVINFAFLPLPNCELEFAPMMERQFYIDAADRVDEDVAIDLGDEDAEQIAIQVKACVRDRRWGEKVSVSWFEDDPEYDSDFDRELTIKRYLRLINSSTYYEEPAIEPVDLPRGRPPKQGSKPEDVPLPPYLIVTGRRIVPSLKKKVLGAIALHSHCLGTSQKIDIHTLFYETKLFGYRYNYKTQKWECG